MTLPLTGAGPSSGVSLKLTSILPTSADQGETANIVVTGKGFKAGDTAAFGTGVTINSTTVDSATQLTVNITVATTATAGTRTLTVTQGSKNVTLADCLTLDYGYLLLDQFITDDAAPLTSPRTCEPGPGTLTAVETDGTIAISGGKLVLTAQSTPTWGDNGIYTSAIARAAGRCLLANLTFTGGSYLWWGWDYGFATGASSIRFENGTVEPYSESNTKPYAATVARDGTAYELVDVMRATGKFLLIKGGEFTNWTLLNVLNAGTTANLYAILHNSDTGISADNLRVPTQVWTPTPLVSDNFTRTNSEAIGSSAGGGCEESGGTGVAVTEVAGDWHIDTNRLITDGDVPAGTGFIATWAAGVSAVVAQVQVTLQTNSLAGIVLSSDGTDWYRVAIDDANNVIRVHEYDGAGTYTQRASTAVAIAASTAYQLLAVRDGSTVMGWVNNYQTASYTSASVNATATAHGLASATAADAFDNFVVWNRTQSVPSF